MNIKAFSSLLFLIIFTVLHAQKLAFSAPDYSLIQKNIADKNSEFYYPKLLNRLKENDTLLTKSQYRHLYFGYTFQKDYKPYKTSKRAKEMTSYYRGEGSSENDLPKGIQLFREALEENPFDLRAMNHLSYMYHLTNDDRMAKKVAANFHGLLRAILTSGDGLKCETGFHVISVTDEYVLLNRFQMETLSQSSSNTCDYHEFEKGKYKIPGLYFNTSKFYGRILD
ncbi:DUF4919 domain-containing protein [Chryseobacterium lactis]|uniref:DUF4919 domain-containing protein n=1 Tax=Chryseobacterium lactis TaxID=1241981 RepID=A0A3G6RV66_CHRLC|nr:DUF4919 domain-containing protein [Chryseobacterium lactis]AZA80774.1 DUF4919 domain-containing protein [Chryseobacterium lactis]AZB05776.1 DUF4919 domain-containing protein [Chryseobacterium lactis]PNW13505.1 DUF4919 domain-containing protein [Chryseobacterium lactis]